MTLEPRAGVVALGRPLRYAELGRTRAACWQAGPAVQCVHSRTMLPSLTGNNSASVVSQAMQPSGTLTRMFEDLKSKDKAVRNHAGKELGNFVSYMLSELKGERLQLFTNELNRRVIELSHSTLSASKLGGITAIDHFIGLESEDNSARLYLSLIHI